MTPDEIQRLTLRRDIETYEVRYTVECKERNWDYPETTLIFTHDTTLRSAPCPYDGADIAMRVNRILSTHLVKELEHQVPPQVEEARPIETYESVDHDARHIVAERARWAVWRLAHPELVRDQPKYSVAKDHGLLHRLWARMLELEGENQ